MFIWIIDLNMQSITNKGPSKLKLSIAFAVKLDCLTELFTADVKYNLTREYLTGTFKSQLPVELEDVYHKFSKIFSQLSINTNN